MKATFLSAILCLPLCGCMNLMVPRTTIKGSIAGQPFLVSSPKDSTLQGLTVTADTNGAVSIKLQSLTATMNPEVITTTGDAQQKMIQTVIDGVIAAMAAGAK